MKLGGTHGHNLPCWRMVKLTPCKAGDCFLTVSRKVPNPNSSREKESASPQRVELLSQRLSPKCGNRVCWPSMAVVGWIWHIRTDLPICCGWLWWKGCVEEKSRAPERSLMLIESPGNLGDFCEGPLKFHGEQWHDFPTPANLEGLRFVFHSCTVPGICEAVECRQEWPWESPACSPHSPSLSLLP